jgi:hypothetical protein
MCENQLDRDTLLVVNVAGRIEKAVCDNWGLCEDDGSLARRINTLPKGDIDRAFIEMLHYLRKERNEVIHYPRSELADRKKFEMFAEAALPLIEKCESPEQFLTPSIRQLIAELHNSIEKEAGALRDDVDWSVDSLREEIADEIASMKDSLRREW